MAAETVWTTIRYGVKMMVTAPAIFLDRDGVLIEDVDLLTNSPQIRILDGVASALEILKNAGYKLIVISNQPVVARGLVSEQNVLELQEEIGRRLVGAGAPSLDAFYYCPHHPNATRAEYRVNCGCRKPKPGLLLLAAEEHQIELKRSFMVGDRITDIIAGARAGCRTVLVETGKHLALPIETSEPLDLSIKPDYSCPNLPTAVKWIMETV